MPASKDLVGLVFERLTVLKKTNNRDASGSIQWLCKCSCENETKVKVSTNKLNTGHTRSCGCLQKESAKIQGLASRKHGAAKIKKQKGGAQLDYSIWAGMKNRCYNKNSPKYPRYGGRGIKVCKEWRDDFSLFASYIRTLPNCPSDEMLKSRFYGKRIPRTIDRIKNDKDYKPGNIKWSTSKEQASNRSTNVVIKYKGKEMTLKQAVEAYSSVPYSVVRDRYNKYGWDLKSALTKPLIRNSGR